NWQTHTLKRGETLHKLAAQRGMDVTRLKQINGITARTKVGPGLNLLVPRPGSQTSHEQISRALPQLPPEKVVAAKSKSKDKKRAAAPVKKSAAKPADRKTVKPKPKK
ncbi:MAG: LysM domain-containing protein, partial [Rhodocyclaceae bacterium]|nr:LysM domain-containing protein [Rhodocyclaceae bacterium]